MDQEFITYEQAGRMLGVSKWTIRRKVETGEIKAFRLGDSPGAAVRVRAKDVRALMTPAN